MTENAFAFGLGAVVTRPAVRSRSRHFGHIRERVYCVRTDVRHAEEGAIRKIAESNSYPVAEFVRKLSRCLIARPFAG